MKYPDRMTKHSDRELYLSLFDEEAMCLDVELHNGDRTARVQVNLRFKDQNGTVYGVSRIVKMQVKREGNGD